MVAICLGLNVLIMEIWLEADTTEQCHNNNTYSEQNYTWTGRLGTLTQWYINATEKYCDNLGRFYSSSRLLYMS